MIHYEIFVQKDIISTNINTNAFIIGIDPSSQLEKLMAGFLKNVNTFPMYAILREYKSNTETVIKELRRLRNVTVNYFEEKDPTFIIQINNIEEISLALKSLVDAAKIGLYPLILFGGIKNLDYEKLENDQGIIKKILNKVDTRIEIDEQGFSIESKTIFKSSKDILKFAPYDSIIDFLNTDLT